MVWVAVTFDCVCLVVCFACFLPCFLGRSIYYLIAQLYDAWLLVCLVVCCSCLLGCWLGSLLGLCACVPVCLCACAPVCLRVSVSLCLCNCLSVRWCLCDCAFVLLCTSAFARVVRTTRCPTTHHVGCETTVKPFYREHKQRDSSKRDRTV